MAVEDKALKSASSSGDLAKAACAAGGLLAAFGVASCCALPVALSLLGISAASLVGIGFVAAQYQKELFFGALLLLATTLFMMMRRRHSGRLGLEWASRLAIVVAIGLLLLTFRIEPPI